MLNKKQTNNFLTFTSLQFKSKLVQIFEKSTSKICVKTYKINFNLIKSVEARSLPNLIKSW